MVMTFDLKAAVSRLKASNLLAPGSSIFANLTAAKQFNIYLTEAKKHFADHLDIIALENLEIRTGLYYEELLDSINRLSECLNIVPSNHSEIELSQKFGILRSVNQLDKDLETHSNDNGGIGLLFFDIDNFKKYNTKYTESVVDDKLLIPIQNFILDFIKFRGYGYSVGGDEFIILLFNSSKPESLHFGERLRRTVESLNWEIENNSELITISIGVSSFPEDTSDFKLLKDYANKAENVAKKNGKNRIESWSNN